MCLVLPAELPSGSQPAVIPLLEGVGELWHVRAGYPESYSGKCIVQAVLSTFLLFICFSPLLLQGDQLHVAN